MRGLGQELEQHRLQRRQARHLPDEGFLVHRLLGQQSFGMRRTPQQAKNGVENRHEKRLEAVRPIIPQVFDHLSQAGFRHELGRQFTAQTDEQPQKQLQGGTAERRVEFPQVAGEAEEADGFRSEELAQRIVAALLGTAEQVGQTFLAIELTQAPGQIDPVPALFQGIVGQAMLQLAIENIPGRLRADLGQGAHLKDVVHSGPQTGFDPGRFAAFEKVAETGPKAGDDGLVELSALKEFDVLPAHDRKLGPDRLLSVQVPAEQKRRGQQHGKHKREDQDGNHGLSQFTTVIFE